jgi:hypothetical protein
LDREQQLRIDMMKMRAQSEAQQQQLSHEDKSKKREGRAKQNDALIKAGKDPMPEGMDTDAMVGVFKELIAEMSKPKRVVRGEDGRAVGVETVQ